MTTIGTSLPSVPLSRDLSGSPDQSGTSDEASGGADGRSGYFASYLAKLSQSAENSNTASPAPSNAAVPESLKALAAGETAATTPETGAGRSAEPADLVASLASLATATSKSGAQTNSAAPPAGTKASQAALSWPLSSLKSAAGQVTGLLGRITQNTTSASASVAQRTSIAGTGASGNLSAAGAAAEATGAGATGPAQQGAAAGASLPSLGQATEKVTEKPTANDTAATSPLLANGLSVAAAATASATSKVTQAKNQVTQESSAAVASSGSTRRLRSGTDDGETTSASPDPTSASAIAGQPIAAVMPIVGAPSANTAKANAPNNTVGAVASGADRLGTVNALAQLNDAAPSLSDSPDGAATAGTLHAAASLGPVEMKITALSAATHFAPVAQLSPVQQISDAVAASVPSLVGGQNGAGAASAADLGRAAGPSPQASANAPSLVAQPSASAIKTLSLQLQPENLGQVTIKLNLSDNGLAVQLEAAHQQTADLLDKDKQALTQKLTQSGYTISSVEVSSTSHSSHLSSETSSQQGQPDANAGQSGGPASGSGGSSNGERQAHDQAASAETSHNASNIAAADGTAAQPRPGGSGELFV